MSNEVEFPEGIMWKDPRQGSPEYVRGSVSIKRQELIDWLSGRDGDWVNLDLKESKGGKVYFAVNNWKPDSQKGGGSGGSRGGAPQRQRPQSSKPAPTDDFDDQDIPFISNKGEW